MKRTPLKVLFLCLRSHFFRFLLIITIWWIGFGPTYNFRIQLVAIFLISLLLPVIFIHYASVDFHHQYWRNENQKRIDSERKNKELTGFFWYKFFIGIVFDTNDNGDDRKLHFTIALWGIFNWRRVEWFFAEIKGFYTSLWESVKTQFEIKNFHLKSLSPLNKLMYLSFFYHNG